MGSLGGVVASRIAREFQIGGPSFSVSCDENSGIQALAIAADWLERDELDAVVVGAVDFAGDIRAVLARARIASDPDSRLGQFLWDEARGQAISTPRTREGEPPGEPCSKAARTEPRPPAITAPLACDGAVCLIVKRLDDARRDGDHIEAIVRGATTHREQIAPNSSHSRLRKL